MDENTKSRNYNNAISHFYRGELQRTYNWRERLDRTTNWAILIIAGILTWSFSSSARTHFVLLIGLFFVLLLSLIEARRYRTYVVWNSRVRVLEENFLTPILCPDEKVKKTDWSKILADDLNQPKHKIGFAEAFARRLRRIYIWLFTTIIISWVAKLAIHPQTAGSLLEMAQRASIGRIDGIAVMAAVGGFLVMMFITSLYRWGNKYGVLPREAKGGLRPRYEKETNWKEV